MPQGVAATFLCKLQIKMINLVKVYLYRSGFQKFSICSLTKTKNLAEYLFKEICWSLRLTCP